MSRWIDAEWLLNFFEPYPNDYQTPLGSLRACVDDAPSIDICLCRECKYTEFCEKKIHRHGIAYSIDFCSHGSSSEKPNNSND